MTADLIPCPFCGHPKPNGPRSSSNSDERNGYNFTVTIKCVGCGASISRDSSRDALGWCNDGGEAVRQAVAAWNRRSPQ